MKNKKIVLCLGMFSICVGGYLYWQNNGISIKKYNYEKEKLKDFKNYKILHVSDLQNKSFGKNNKILINKMKKLNPDIIVFTGDLVDRNRTDVPVVLDFASEIVNIAPVYFVTGNHEHQAPDNTLEILLKGLNDIGVKVLDNDKTVIEKGESKIDILGLKDHYVNREYSKVLDNLTEDCNGQLKILLTHRPELFETYSEKNIDLVFAGHAHGGQIRIPFIGGIFAPHQGFFPELSEGRHTKNNTTIFISRGLGNSTFPFRVNNRPELILLTVN